MTNRMLIICHWMHLFAVSTRHAPVSTRRFALLKNDRDSVSRPIKTDRKETGERNETKRRLGRKFIQVVWYMVRV